jgi:hypothetical protein
VNGPQPLAIQVIDLGAATAPAAKPASVVTVPGYRVVSFERAKRSSTVVVADNGSNTNEHAKLTYRTRPGRQVVLDAPASASGNAQVTATPKDGQCDVSVVPASSGGLPAKPLAFVLSERCEIKLDGAQVQPQVDVPAGPTNTATESPVPAGSASSVAAPPPPVKGARGCGCGEVPTRDETGFRLSAFAIGLLGLVMVTRRARMRS